MAARRTRGTVQCVDIVGREITVLQLESPQPSGIVAFEVPPNCTIYLRGEQIKLRMLQARDLVEIEFIRDRDRHVATCLEVKPHRVHAVVAD